MLSPRLSVIISAILLAVTVQAENVTVEATGTVVKGENFIETRKLALIEAQKSAVEMAVGAWVEAHYTVSKSILEKGLIETGTEGRILSYRILSEGTNGEFYRVKIHALIDLQGKRFAGQTTVREALSNLNVNTLYGAITFVNGVRPTAEELRVAINDPIPVVAAYVEKVSIKVPNIEKIVLLAAVAKSLGLPHSGQDVMALEKILQGKQ